MKAFFGCIALVVLCLAGPVRSGEVQEEPVDSLANLIILSDSLQARLIGAIATRDVDLYRSLIPNALGIIWPGGQNLSGKEATQRYDSAFMAIFGGSEITCERQSIETVVRVEGYVRELGEYKIIVPVNDSTTQTHTGHFTSYWEWKDGNWNWRRIFLTER